MQSRAIIWHTWLASHAISLVAHRHSVVLYASLPFVTVETLLLSKEINPKIVQERLGHSSINLTLNTYSHVIKSMRDIAANALEDVVGFVCPNNMYQNLF
jgi:integrase